MQNFSASANIMSFNISFGNGNLKPVLAAPLNLSQSNKFLMAKSSSGKSNIYIIDNSTLMKYDLAGNLLKSITAFSEIEPATFDYNGSEYIVGAKGEFLNLYLLNSGNETTNSIDLLTKITAISVDKVTAAIPQLIIGTSTGSVYTIQIDAAMVMKQFLPNNYLIYKGDAAILNLGIDNNFYSILQAGKIIAHSVQDAVYQFDSNALKSVLSKDSNGNHSLIVLGGQNKFYIFGSSNFTFQVNSQNSITDFAVADLFGDGQNYILVADGISLEAFNFRGSMAGNLPFKLYSGENFIGLPLVLDINNNGENEILGFTDKGNVYAINPNTGKIIDGFPISSGAQTATAPVIISEDLKSTGVTNGLKPYLTVLDKSNNLYVWNLAPVQGQTFWGGEYNDALNSSLADAPSVSNRVSDFFPADKAYNWPNPVYSGETKIRYYVSENSNVTIKIFDLAGGLVANISTRANGGLDNETPWDVSKIQSGVYYAHLQVNGDSGKSAQKIIKIAVIK